MTKLNALMHPSPWYTGRVSYRKMVKGGQNNTYGKNGGGRVKGSARNSARSRGSGGIPSHYLPSMYMIEVLSRIAFFGGEASVSQFMPAV